MQCLERIILRKQISQILNSAAFAVRNMCTDLPRSGETDFFDSSKEFDESLETDSNLQKNPQQNLSFATLLRRSNFMNLGDPEGKIVVGKIFHIVNSDLYIDFGWKFHCVCQRPTKNGEDYVRGAKVRLKIKDLELSTRFLGSTKDVTLLEADCILLGLIWTPNSIAPKHQLPSPEIQELSLQ